MEERTSEGLMSPRSRARGIISVHVVTGALTFVAALQWRVRQATRSDVGIIQCECLNSPVTELSARELLWV